MPKIKASAYLQMSHQLEEIVITNQGGNGNIQ